MESRKKVFEFLSDTTVEFSYLAANREHTYATHHLQVIPEHVHYIQTPREWTMTKVASDTKSNIYRLQRTNVALHEPIDFDEVVEEKTVM